MSCESIACGLNQVCSERVDSDSGQSNTAVCACLDGYAGTPDLGCPIHQATLEVAWKICFSLALISLTGIVSGVILRQWFQTSSSKSKRRSQRKRSLLLVVIMNSTPAVLILLAYTRRTSDTSLTMLTDTWVLLCLSDFLCLTGIITLLIVVKYCDYLKKKQRWIVKENALGNKLPAKQRALGLCDSLRNKIQTRAWNNRVIAFFLLYQHVVVLNLSNRTAIMLVAAFWIVFLPYVAVILWSTSASILKDYQQILALEKSSDMQVSSVLSRRVRKAQRQVLYMRNGTCIYCATFFVQAFLTFFFPVILATSEIMFTSVLVPFTLILQVSFFLMETSKRIRNAPRGSHSKASHASSYMGSFKINNNTKSQVLPVSQ